MLMSYVFILDSFFQSVLPDSEPIWQTLYVLLMQMFS